MEGAYPSYVTFGSDSEKEENGQQRKALAQARFFFDFWVRIFNAVIVETEGAYCSYVTFGSDIDKEENTTQN
jgi:hypothetical protein